MKKILKFLKFCTVLGILAVVAFYVICALLPKPELLENTMIRLYGHDMQVFYKTSNQSSIEWIYYDEVPQDVINTTIAVEDKHFFHHFGIDPLRLTKALYQNIAS